MLLSTDKLVNNANAKRKAFNQRSNYVNSEQNIAKLQPVNKYANDTNAGKW